MKRLNPRRFKNRKARKRRFLALNWGYSTSKMPIWKQILNTVLRLLMHWRKKLFHNFAMTTSITPVINHSLPLFLAYLRVSKDDETTGSHTFETQEKRIRECLDRRHGKGNYVLEVFRDDGISGGLSFRSTETHKKTRPTLARIAERIESEECAGLIIYGQNRLFRNVQALTELINEVLLPSNTLLISATEDIDITTSDGRAMVYLRGIFDEKVRVDISKRNLDAAATRAEAGYINGQVPYGWMWEGTHRVPGTRRRIAAVEEEKQWLLHMKDRYLSGWNAVKIAQELNDKGVLSPLHRALWKNKAVNRMERVGRVAKWTASEVWRILNSPLHSGQVRLKSGEFIRGQHYEARFWEPEQAQQLEDMHCRRVGRFKTVAGRHNTPYLLNGLAFCARCGSRLYIQSSSPTTRSYTSLRCQNRDTQQNFTCPDLVARNHWIEEVVIEELSKITQAPALREILETQLQDNFDEQNAMARVALLQARKNLKALENQAVSWADSWSRGLIGEAQFTAFSYRLNDDSERAREEIQRLEAEGASRAKAEPWFAKARHAFTNFPLLWENLDNDERRQLLSLLIEPQGLLIDRAERDITVRLKIQLLPHVERTIINRTYRGINRTKATGLMRLTQTQMLLIHHALQGKSRPQIAEAMDCKVASIYSLEKTIRKNMGGISWTETLELARERVEANAAQIENAHPTRKRGAAPKPKIPFLSPVLMEVFVLFAQGATCVEVALELQLSVVTVAGRRARLLKAFGTSSMLEAVRAAQNARILPTPVR